MKTLSLWAAVAGLLHLVWEVAQLPLYTIYSEGTPREIAFAVAHCTAGDVLIALTTYLLAALATRTLRWPVERPLAGLGIACAAGLSYTAFSEWLNVFVRGSWAYAPSMPRLAGIGVAPLLQWVLVPLATLYFVRMFERRQPGI